MVHRQSLLRVAAAAFLLISTSFIAFAPLGVSAASEENGRSADPHTCVNDKDDDDDELIFSITPDQREALVDASTSEEIASRLRDYVEVIREKFANEGLVVIRGLFDDDLLERLEKEATTVAEELRAPGQHFASLKFGPVFYGPDHISFREAALSSAVPHFVAKVLLNLDKDTNLRLLKDAFLCKGEEEKCCGWHVDDAGFWPTDARNAPGVNAWIAIDDMPSAFGGGIAVSPRSHLAPWRHEAYHAIGSTQIFGKDGLNVTSPLFKDKSVFKTCDMEKQAPALAAKIDVTKRLFNFKKGDVLFHTRWLFHRSEPLKDAERAAKGCLKRYSIRYELGTARLIPGLSLEHAVLLNSENNLPGTTLDDVCGRDGPWYPRCWPEVSSAEMDQIHLLVEEKFEEAEGKKKEKMQEIMQHFA